MFRTICFLVLCLSQVLLAQVSFKNAIVEGVTKSHNKFKKNFESAENLKEVLPDEDLEELALVYNSVHVLHGNAISKVKVDTLSLSVNVIKTIKAFAFNSSSISTLLMINCEISDIESNAFANLESLKVLDLSINKIAAWNSDWFRNCDALNHISIKFNLLKEIPSQAFKNLNTGKGNPLNAVFSYNQIETVAEDAFKYVTAVEKLYLDNNKISKIPYAALRNLEVEILNLQGNEIKEIGDDFDTTVLGQRLTYLDENPFDCDTAKKIANYISPLKLDMMHKQVFCHLKQNEEMKIYLEDKSICLN